MAGGRPAIATFDCQGESLGEGYGGNLLTKAFRDSARFALRDRTAAAHERLDVAFSRLDLSAIGGLATFLSANLLAYRSVELILRSADGLPNLPERITALELDLAQLGRPVPEGEIVDLSQCDPLGIAYVAGGSALGSRILRQRRLASADPLVRGAGRFMDDPRMMPYWIAVQGVLRTMAPEEPRFDAVARGAVAAFNVYGESLRRVERDARR